MTDIKVDWRKLQEYANKMENINKEMDTDLKSIQKKITSLEGDQYESNSAVTIKEKIQGMTGRFQQYYDIVNNYVVFLRRTAQEFETAEGANDSTAKTFK